MPIEKPLDPISRQNLNDEVILPYTTTLPTYAGRQGDRIIYFDGTNYWLYIFENGAWRTQQLGITQTPAASTTIGVNTTQTSVSNTTTETILWTMTVPANTLGSNKAVWGKGGLQITNNSGANRLITLTFYYGPSSTATVSMTVVNVNGAFNYVYDLYVVADGGTGNQRLFFYIQKVIDQPGNVTNINAAGGDLGTFAMDSTINEPLSLTIKFPTASVNLNATSQSVIVTKLI